jgi:hypothetical protein
MLAIGTFLAGPLGKLAEWAIGIIFILAVCVGGYFIIVHNAAQNQLLKDQAVIQEQVIKNQEEFAKKTADILQLQQQSADDLTKQLKDVQDNTDSINAQLNSPDTAKTDRATSALLKNVIKQLSGVVKP